MTPLEALERLLSMFWPEGGIELSEAEDRAIVQAAREALPLARAQAEELERKHAQYADLLAANAVFIAQVAAQAEELERLRAELEYAQGGQYVGEVVKMRSQLTRQAAVIEAAKELVTAQYEDEIEQSLDHLKDALDALSSDEGATE